MGAVVVRIINRCNRLFDKGDAHALHVKEHIGLILKALAVDLAEISEILCRNSAQTCLGICQLNVEKQAEKEIDLRTFNRIRAKQTLLTVDVQECACAIAEFLCEAENVIRGAAAQGFAGPLAAWSNDGESGSVDLSQSCYTESGKKAKIRELIYLYLSHTGLLYAGV